MTFGSTTLDNPIGLSFRWSTDATSNLGLTLRLIYTRILYTSSEDSLIFKVIKALMS